jgi:hypothetical protein
VERRCRVWWLYDRFAVRSWLRWRPSGVGLLVCESSAADENRLAPDLPQELACRGVNLAMPVARWLAERMAAHGPRQTRLVERIDAHFRRVRPHALVLDQDGTPMARAAAALARRHGAASWVVQHGAPVCRFGFAPLAADRIVAWGRALKNGARLADINWREGAPQRYVVTRIPRRRTGRCLRRRTLTRKSRTAT